MMFRETLAWCCRLIVVICMIPAIAASWAAAEEHCCRDVPWGTVTVAVHEGRLITTGVDPQHPSAFALDKVLGDDASEVVLGAAVQLRTPAPEYATKSARVVLEVGASGSVEVKVRNQVIVSRTESQAYRPVQLSAEVDLAGVTPIQIKATRPKEGRWLVRVRLKRMDDDIGPLHCLCRANVRNRPPEDSDDGDSDDLFANVKSVSLFDGKTLTGWSCPAPRFRVEEGAIVASWEPREKAHHYLLTDKQYGDFELTLKVRMEGRNSGIYFRSHREPGTVDAHGYQCDVGSGLWGTLYDERGTRIIGVSRYNMPPGFDRNDWVDCRIRCVGPRIQYWLNGHKTLDYIEEDTTVPRKGSVGLQYHRSTHAFRVWFKDIQIRELK